MLGEGESVAKIREIRERKERKKGEEREKEKNEVVMLKSYVSRIFKKFSILILES